MNELFYAVKPYAVAAFGLFGITTGTTAGVIFGLILIAAAAYIWWMRNQSRGNHD